MALDLVAVDGRTVEFGQDVATVKALWAAHADLDLPWHYFAKQIGHLQVEIAPLRVQRCPLTWGELEQVDRTLARRKPARDGADHPVDNLTFAEAAETVRLLAEYHGRPLRLPTEYEWEYLARGTGDRAYPWGEEYDPRCCNLAEAGVGRSEPVGHRPRGASEHGILDLAGNVDEWTSSVYAPFPGAHWTVPRVESWAVDPHVTRGGSFAHHRDLALARRRHAIYRPWIGAGIRVVEEVR